MRPLNIDPCPDSYRCRCGGKVVRKLFNEHDPSEMQLRWYCSKCDQYFGFPWFARQWKYPESGTVLVGLDPWVDDSDLLPPTVESPVPRLSVAAFLRRAVPATIISAASIVLMVNFINKAMQPMLRTFITCEAGRAPRGRRRLPIPRRAR